MSKEIDEWEDYEHYLNGKTKLNFFRQKPIIITKGLTTRRKSWL